MSEMTGIKITLGLQGQDAVVNGVRGVASEIDRASNSSVASFGKTRAGVQSISNELQKLESYAKTWLTFSAFSGLAASAIKTADEYIGLQARLKLATTSQLEFNTANAALYAIAQKNGVPLAESLSLYSKLSPALREMGASQAQTLTMTDLLGKSLRLSGAGAAESSSAMLQFSQALGSGVLRGDEFNSLMEASPRLMKAVADGLNKPIGELRKMAEQGQLTSDVVVNALLSQKSKLESEYSSLPLTVSAAWTKLGNAVTQEIGRIDKAGGGLSGGLAQALGGVAGNLTNLEQAFVSAAKTGTAVFVASMLAAKTAAIEAAGIAGIGMLRNAVAGLALLYAEGGIAALASGIMGVGAASAAATPPALTLGAAISAIVWPAAIAYGVYEFGKYAFETFKGVRLGIAELVASAQRGAAVMAHPLDAFSGNSAHQARMAAINAETAAIWAMENAQQVSSKVSPGELAKITPKASVAEYLAGGQSKEQKRSKELADEATHYAAMIAQAKGNKTLLEQIETAHQVRLDAIAAKYKDKTAKTAPADKAAAKAAAESLKWEQDSMAALGQTTRALLDKAAAAEQSNSLIGLTAQQLALATEAEYNNQIAVQSAELYRAQQSAGQEARVFIIEQQIQALARLRDAESARPVLQANEAKKAAEQKAAEDAAKATDEAFKRRGEAISSTLSDALMRGFEGGKGATQNFADTFKNMFKTMILEPRIKASVQPLAEALNKIIDSFAKGIADAMNQKNASGGSWMNTAGSWLASLFNANGNAFASQGVQAFASGGSFANTIVSQATPFAFGGGKLGVMGEAGPEAVMPLTRTAGGQLGVRAELSGSIAPANLSGRPMAYPAQAMNIVINNHAPGVQATATQQKGDNGQMSLVVMVEQVEAMISRNVQRGSGVLAGAMENTYALNRAAGAMR